MSDRYSLFTVSSGSSFVVSSFFGSGYPRIFEAFTALYVYGLYAKLKESVDAGVTFSDVEPSGVTVSAMAQTGTTTFKAVIFGRGVSYYQTSPGETAGGWTTTGSMPAGFSPVDAVADVAGKFVLVGNGLKGATAHVVKSNQTEPYSFANSSTGLPVNPISDLELP